MPNRMRRPLMKSLHSRISPLLFITRTKYKLEKQNKKFLYHVCLMLFAVTHTIDHESSIFLRYVCVCLGKFLFYETEFISSRLGKKNIFIFLFLFLLLKLKINLLLTNTTTTISSFHIYIFIFLYI